MFTPQGSIVSPSKNKTTRNVGHKYLCSPQESICLFRVSPHSFSSSSTSALKPIHVLCLALSSCLSSFNTCQLHCLPLKKGKAMLLRPFQWLSPNRAGAFVPVPFFPGFGAISKGASVFPLREAWCSLLAGCDNGPHMVVLRWFTKTWGLGAWAQAPALPTLP